MEIYGIEKGKLPLHNLRQNFRRIELPIQNFTIAEFLNTQATNFSSRLPLVHTTEAANTHDILNNRTIAVEDCDVFTEEKLAYFFLGRPAYKLKNQENPHAWQLPLVLILDRSCILNPNRVFPFDSGAFANEVLPDSITRFPVEGYEVQSLDNASDLLIDVFFGSDDQYLHGDSKSLDEIQSRFDMDMEFQQVLALSALYHHPLKGVDDRKMAIEFQSQDDIDFSDSIIGAVLPKPFEKTASIVQSLHDLGAEVEFYNVHPIDLDSYYASIYDKVTDIYRRVGILP